MDTLEYRIELCQAAAEQLTQYLQTLSPEEWCHPAPARHGKCVTSWAT